MAEVGPEQSGGAFRVGEWTVRPQLGRLDRGDASVRLEPKVMDVLACLADRAGEVVSKDDLLDRVWGVEHLADGTLSHAVADLRRALGDDARRPRYVETIPKRGYRLIAAVAPAPPAEGTTETAGPRFRGPWRVAAVSLLVAVAAVAWIAVRIAADRPAHPPRIVILPFASLGEGADGSFAAGLTDEIISRLAAVRGLQVVSRTTAFQYDPGGRTVRDIGRDLGVDYILEGAVRWGEDGEPRVVRITPQLIRVSDDGHLWSGLFDRHPDRVLDVQSEIARQIVAHLDLRLARQESEVVARPPTDDPAAYRAYLEALERRGSFDRRDIEIAVQMYRRAVEADPGFADAWAGLAEASGAIHHFGYDRAPERCATARTALGRARELAPESPATMRADGFFAYHCNGDAAGARSAFGRALDRWPGDALAMGGMAYACRRSGRWDEAVRWFRRALELDPRNATVLWNLGATLTSMHRYDEGRDAVTQAIELAPDLRAAHFAEVVALWLGRGDVGLAARVLDRAPGPRDATWYEYAFRNALYAGDVDAASRIARDSPPGPMSPFQRCLAVALSGADAAAACSEAAAHYRAIRDREPDALWPRLLLARCASLDGRHAEAEREAAAAVAMRPVETDALGRNEALVVQAQVLARAGRVDAAAALVERMLADPSEVSPARLEIDPEWAPLRDHPRIRERIRAGGSAPAHGVPSSSAGSGRTPRVSEK